LIGKDDFKNNKVDVFLTQDLFEKVLRKIFVDIGEINKDAAQEITVLDNASYGGIDLNAANLNMQIKRDGAGMPLPAAQQDLSNFKIDGLVPVVLNIEPVVSLPALQ
jgi:hypothetical protein